MKLLVLKGKLVENVYQLITRPTVNQPLNNNSVNVIAPMDCLQNVALNNKLYLKNLKFLVLVGEN